MKLKIATKELLTEDGDLIKTLNCPIDKGWNELQSQSNSDYRYCSHCNHKVWDTNNKTEDELQQMVNENPNICFKIDLNQTNITQII